MSDTPEPLAAVLAEMRGIAGNMETAAKKFDVEHRQDERCRKHPHCFRADDLLRDANGLRDWADRIEAAAAREREAYCDLCKEKDAAYDRLLLERDTGNASSCAPMSLDEAIKHAEERADGSPCGQAHAQLAGWLRELRDLRNAPGNSAAMRAALLSAARAMEIESRISCTEKWKIGKFGNTLSELCKGCRARDCECWQMTLKREVESALAAPPEPPSNAVALRAALEWVAEFVELGVDDEYGVDGQNLTIAAEKARAALAAPARNCDRPECRTEEGASATYIAEHPHAVEPDASTYGSWLLATAEGGAE